VRIAPCEVRPSSCGPSTDACALVTDGGGIATPTHFVSEIGCRGCPGRASLEPMFDPEFDFILAAQVTQAEALKFWMDFQRIGKRHRWGILVWDRPGYWPGPKWFFAVIARKSSVRKGEAGSPAPFCRLQVGLSAQA